MLERSGSQRWVRELEFPRALAWAAMLAGLLDAGWEAVQSARWVGIVPGLSLAGVALLVWLSPAPASRRARVLWAALAVVTIAGIGLIGPFAGGSGDS